MTELIPPDELTAENELICEKLLGWKVAEAGWIKQDGFMYGGCGTPSFTTWAEAGLILDRMSQMNWVMLEKIADWTCSIDSGYEPTVGVGSTAIAAIRDAALKYIGAKS